MLVSVVKLAIAAGVISFSSWLSGKKPELAGFIMALPIATLLNSNRACADVHLGRLDSGKQLVHRPARARGQWVHVIAGDVLVLGENLTAGDGLAIEHADELEFESRDNSQLLLFDLN